MGSGSSKNDPAVIERLDRIEGILGGLKTSEPGTLTNDAMNMEQLTALHTQLREYNANANMSSDTAVSAPPAEASPRRSSERRRSSVTFEPSPVKKAVSGIVGDQESDAPKREAIIENKKKQQEVKARRRSFFEKYRWSEPSPPAVGKVKCSAIGCVALALSQLVSKHNINVTVSDIFCDLKLPVHLVTLPSLTMAEVYDITAKYIAVSDKLKNLGISAKVVHFDIDHVATEDDDGYVLEPVLSLLGFRKELAIDMQDTQVTHILNYDPYVVQEDRICRFADEEEELDEDDNAEESNKRMKDLQKTVSSMRVINKKNQGAFAVLSSYNPTLHNVQISNVYNTEAGIQVTQDDIPLKVLYDACLQRDGYTKRPRGYVKISMSEQKTEGDHRRIDSTQEGRLYSPEQLEASNDKGIRLELIDPQVCPHIVGIGLSVHLFNSKNSIKIPRCKNLLGVAVSDMCSILKLPLQTVTAGSDQSALGKAYSYLHYYLQKQNCKDVTVSVCAITRKSGAEDGLPNIDEDELEQQILAVGKKEGKDVMLLNFHVNKSHNVVGLESDGKVSHFGVLAGYNEESRIVAIADVSPKKFKKVWYCPLERLWNSMIGFGFIILSADANSMQYENHIQCAEQFLSCGIYKLPPVRYSLFEFPPKIYCVTVIALALQMLGHVATVENIINSSDIHLSFLLSDHLSLGDLERVFLSYLEHSTLITTIKLDRCNFDVLASTGKQRVEFEDFKSLLESNDNKKSTLIFNYSFTKLAELREDWNGVALGTYSLLQSYDSSQGIVTLLSVSPDIHHRSWQIPVAVLHSLCSEIDPVAGRARGILVASLVSNKPAFNSSISITCMPVEHPFKPPISPVIACTAFAFSLLGHRISAEDIFYSSCLQANGDRLSLHKLSNHLPLDLIVSKALETSSVLSIPVTVEVIQIDGVQDLKKHQSDPNSCLMAVASVSKAIDIIDNNITCVVISSVTDSYVTCTEANPTKYGTHWTASWERFSKATTLDSTSNGIIKFSKK